MEKTNTPSKWENMSVPQDNELDVCPYCGGPAELYISIHIPNGYDFTPRCKKTDCCGRISKKYSSKKAAINHWNMRVPLNQFKSDIIEKIFDIKRNIVSMKNLSEVGFQMIDTDSKFFSSYDSALRYANHDPSILFSKYSMTGETIFIREDDGYIGKYIIENAKTLRKIENDDNDNISDPLYSKSEIDEKLNQG